MLVLKIPKKCFKRQKENNSSVNNAVDKILLNETQKVSAVREAPGFLDSDFDENNIYQVEEKFLEDTKEILE